MKKGFIGIDAGGTKTAGLLTDRDGRVIEQVVRGPGNYQAVGEEGAKEVLSEVLKALLHTAESHDLQVEAIGYGLSGWDRPQDEERIRGIVSAVHPGGPFVIVNDTFLILRAGTVDNTGIAVVSGTGSNCVGRSSDGRTYRIGGLCFEMGDFGSGWDIAVAGLRAAKRGTDGRGPWTLIHDLALEEFNASSIDDLMDFLLPGKDPGELFGRMTPLVFQAAAKGDQVAVEILVQAGRELGMTAGLVGTELFGRNEPVTCVLGGSVLNSTTSSIMRKALEDELRRILPRARVKRLFIPPAAGAVLLAMDLVLEKEQVKFAHKNLQKI